MEAHILVSGPVPGGQAQFMSTCLPSTLSGITFPKPGLVGQLLFILQNPAEGDLTHQSLFHEPRPTICTCGLEDRTAQATSCSGQTPHTLRLSPRCPRWGRPPAAPFTEDTGAARVVSSAKGHWPFLCFSFNKYFLKTCYVPDSKLNTRFEPDLGQIFSPVPASASL